MENKKWKKTYVDKKTINFIFSSNIINNKKKYLKRYKRSITVLPNLLDNIFVIHKGNLFRTLKPFKYTIGFKLGEFAFTRKPFFFPKRIKKKKNLLRR